MFPEHQENDVSVLTFNLTWHCPVRCSYCYRAKTVSQSNQDTLRIESLIKECEIASKYGIKEYRFSGGEPTSIGDILFEYADIVNTITGKKPVLMTSGYKIDDAWLVKADKKFSAIAISVENPLEPLQKVVNSKRILEIIRQNTCDDLPLTYGLTMITEDHLRNIPKIFDLLYDNVNQKFFPQLDYPCLKSFVEPSQTQLEELQHSTTYLYKNYGVIPYYFVYLIGSLLWLREDCRRVNINLHPEGNYQIYDSLLERWQLEYRWQNYVLNQQKTSAICKKCDWLDICKHHPFWDLRYDWCKIRKAIFEGIYKGLGVE